MVGFFNPLEIVHEKESLAAKQAVVDRRMMMVDSGYTDTPTELILVVNLLTTDMELSTNNCIAIDSQAQSVDKRTKVGSAEFVDMLLRVVDIYGVLDES